MDNGDEGTGLPFATLVISGDEVNPAAVTAMFGLPPTRSFARGDAYSRGHVRKHGMWALSSEGSVASEDLDDHVAWLLDRIEPVREAFQNYLRSNHRSAFITCFWLSPHGHGGPRFSPQVLRRLGGANLPLQVDTYLADAE